MSADGDRSVAYRREFALYREWRPKTFDDVVEQAHVVKTLKNSILHKRLAHAYLFCGTRGTGKTTLAQILSRAVNCLNPDGAEPCNECAVCKGILAGSVPDVAEIDAASNNSVDNIRNLREDVIYAPAQAKYKVYIIDEVHMLSGGAFNALLKTLEEPPSYVIFILATTEPHKLPATIISRCQRFDFRRISDGAIVERLGIIAKNSGVSAETNALALIAKLSDGALRDAISIFDQCASAGISESFGAANGVAIGAAGAGASVRTVTLSDVLRITGRPGDESLLRCVRAVVHGDIGAIPELSAEINDSGMSLQQFLDGLIGFIRNMMLVKLGYNRSSFPEMSNGAFDEVRALAEGRDLEYIIAIISELSAAAGVIKASANQRILLEVTLAKLCLGRIYKKEDPDGILYRIGELEKKIDAILADRGLDFGIDAEPAPKPVAAITDAVVTAQVNPDVSVTAPAKPDAVGIAPAKPDAVGITSGTSSVSGITPHIPDDSGTTQAKPDAGYAPAISQKPEAVAGPPVAADIPAVSHNEAESSRKVDRALWNKIVAKFKMTGNPMFFSILQSARAEITGDGFSIILPDETASHKSTLSNPDNLQKLRNEVQSATGATYKISVMTERDAQRLNAAVAAASAAKAEAVSAPSIAIPAVSAPPPADPVVSAPPPAGPMVSAPTSASPAVSAPTRVNTTISAAPPAIPAPPADEPSPSTSGDISGNTLNVLNTINEKFGIPINIYP